MGFAGQRLHFVGIGGCGMSGLARMLRAQGARCSGTDRGPSAATHRLIEEGVDVRFEQRGEAIPEDCDAVVISAAIGADHPEVCEAKRRNLPVWKYARMLGRLMDEHRGVAIAGTHGKSTTTSMLGHVAIEAGLDPSVIVGAHCPQLGGNARVGAGDVLIAEACEYDRSFHHYHPTFAAILNIEADHLDHYRDLSEIVEAFGVFARQVSATGRLLVPHDSPCRIELCAGVATQVQTIGFSAQADWRLTLRADLCELQFADRVQARWRAPLPGEHMAYNSAVAAVLAHWLGADFNNICHALESFAGLDRRMQRLGQRDGVTVVDDYGHHPTEVDATLRSLRRRYNPRRLICVFQPHQHSRTRFLMAPFAVSFSEADLVLLPDIFFVRDSEQERSAVSSADLVERLKAQNVDARHLASFNDIARELERTAGPGDLLVTMGAGDVWRVAQTFLAPRERPAASP